MSPNKSVTLGKDSGSGAPGTPLLVTPSDVTDFTNGAGETVLARGISLVVEGAISVETADNGTVILPAGLVTPGMVYPIYCTRINATNTTATGIVIIY